MIKGKRRKNQTKKKRAIFIDVDHTIVDGSTPILFLKFLLKNRLIDKKIFFKGILYELLYYIGLIKYNSTIKIHLYFRKKESADIINDIIERFWEEEIKPRIFKEALELLSDYKRKGYITVMISATPDAILKSLEKFLNVNYNLSSKVKLLPDGFVVTRYAMKWNKHKIIRKFSKEHNIDLKRSISCSDGKNDIPMLLASGEKFVVNPKFFIRIIALIKKWKILRFEEHLKD